MPTAAISRRHLLAGAAATGVGLLTARASYASGAEVRHPLSSHPRVAVVGAGLAGLTCAYRLSQQGVASTVYEADGARVGGRCWTARGLSDGETAEHGGEFIDTAHHRIRWLAAELGLTLDDVDAASRRHRRRHGRLYLDGALRRPSDVYTHLERLQEQAKRDCARSGSWRWDRAGRAARELDEMTAKEWLDRALPSRSDRLLALAVAQYLSGEYGLDADRLSGITMLREFGPAHGPSDQRFHVHDGNDRIPQALVDWLPGEGVQLGHPLRALIRRDDSTYRLLFDESSQAIAADIVVLCLPFTALRRVDLERADLSARKMECIDMLGMGTNAKLLIQFKESLQQYAGFDGVYSDESLETWNSAGVGRRSAGLLAVYSGGRVGSGYDVDLPHSPASASLVGRLIAAISRAVPGLSRGYDGTSWMDHWSGDPWTHGSKSAFLPGQFTRYYGLVGRAEGRLHFGGEHTAMDAQGTLEGAVRSGERCAQEVLQAITSRSANVA